MISESMHDAGVLIVLTFDDDEVMRDCSALATTLLGACQNRRLEQVVDAASVQLLREFASRFVGGALPLPCMLTLIGCEGEPLAVAAQVEKLSFAGGLAWLRVTAIPTPGFQYWVDDLVRSKALLESFAALSSEAMWCIEFSEPVDLSTEDDEIVRQVFENDCHWLKCNRSMARLYNLPSGLDLNKQPVAQYFARNAENEAFIRQIIGANFVIDDALSIDYRHDGAAFYVENNVRADIQDGYLLRLWGTMRDITDFRKANNRLMEAADDVSSILSAVPDAIVVINRSRQVVALNPAFENLSGWSAQQLLGSDIKSVLDLERPLAGEGCWYSINRQRWIAEVRARSGQSVMCDIQSAPIGDEAPERFVLALRPARMPEIPA